MAFENVREFMKKLADDSRSNSSNITATTNVATGAARLQGIFVAAASATPTILVVDNTTGSTPVVIGTFTPVAGTTYTFPNVKFSTGLRVVIGGTVNCTVFYSSNS